MDEDPKMSEMTPRGRNTKVLFEPGDWVALGVAILGLGALVVAVFAMKAAPKKAPAAKVKEAVPEKATPVSTDTAAS
jgi:hydrogenase-4 membrane subunit HyfE